MTYEMLCGRLPFNADTPWEWATQHMTAQPFPFETTPMAAHVPPQMKHAVMRALSKDRNLRPQAVREFYQELTLGTEGPRMSLAGGPRPTGVSYPEAQPALSGGTVAISATPQPMPAIGAPRAGQTQLGEPLFGPPTGPTHRTMADMGAAPGMPAQAITGGMQAYPGAGPTPAPMSPMGAMAPMGGAPMGGAPMGGSQAAQGGGKSSMGLILGIVGGVAVLGVIIGVVVMKSGGDSGSGEVIPVPTGSTTSAATDPTASGTPTTTETPSGTPSTPTTPTRPVGAGSGTPTTPGTGTPQTGVDPKKEAMCKAAISHAQPGNLGIAVGEYRGCDGPSKGAAASKIGSAAMASVAMKGCGAAGDARAAASIGQSAALQKLKADKKCRGL